MPDQSTWTLPGSEISELKEGEVLIRNECISLDPAMRGRLNDGRSYIPHVQIDRALVPMPTCSGTPGMTACFGILEVGEIKKGDVVVVSGAAGR
ncbi:MDR/zinc-dependent alcohol dehydrogenase-like family protein [Neolewinella aurantiaca]|uniref:hypothetical protein n=1 Tax=Neolewinella aurantiaca TaxID=2602767 RepID=UPI001FE90108|nr:hypothetical protein [Neolewinella aurantiaca]